MTITDTYVDLGAAECKKLAAVVAANGGWPKGLEAHGALIASMDGGDEIRITAADVGDPALFATLTGLCGSGGI